MTAERTDAMIISNHRTFYKGEVDWTQSCPKVLFDHNLHPYLGDEELVPVKEILLPYAGVKPVTNN